ncbi:nicotinate-nucleotide--dimethylbenzimidazole phosphoribosyltransferase [Streptomyces sp. NPDC047085]|uniref:nicotinate-nucleotide--dimethylbenzimidazole phosphoribosyltransferase n=1 Tax=Streptomyces sp. NPDC047085 TaxID=3155140 RepID=UPI0033DEB712
MTDTGQVPGEGQPESAGMVEQPGVPAHGAYTYLAEAPAEDEDLLLPGAQGAWGNEVPPPAPEPVVEAVHEPGPHETAGRDSGSVDLSGVRLPDTGPVSVPPSPILSAPHDPTTAVQPPRRPLHLGPPIPDASASPVRSLADRGPAGAPVRQPGLPATGPEYLDVQSPREMAPQNAAPQNVTPWGATPAAAPAQVGHTAQAAETVGPAGETVSDTSGAFAAVGVAAVPGAAQAAVARVAPQAAAQDQVPGEAVPGAEQGAVVHGHDGVQPVHGHDGVYAVDAVPAVAEAGQAPVDAEQPATPAGPAGPGEGAVAVEGGVVPVAGAPVTEAADGAQVAETPAEVPDAVGQGGEGQVTPAQEAPVAVVPGPGAPAQEPQAEAVEPVAAEPVEQSGTAPAVASAQSTEGAQIAEAAQQQAVADAADVAPAGNTTGEAPAPAAAVAHQGAEAAQGVAEGTEAVAAQAPAEAAGLVPAQADPQAPGAVEAQQAVAAPAPAQAAVPVSGTVEPQPTAAAPAPTAETTSATAPAQVPAADPAQAPEVPQAPAPAATPEPAAPLTAAPEATTPATPAEAAVPAPLTGDATPAAGTPSATDASVAPDPAPLLQAQGPQLAAAVPNAGEIATAVQPQPEQQSQPHPQAPEQQSQPKPPAPAQDTGVQQAPTVAAAAAPAGPQVHPAEPTPVQPAGEAVAGSGAIAAAAHPATPAQQPPAEAADPLPSSVPLEPHPEQPLGQFVPVDGSVPTTPHLAPTPPQPLILPTEEQDTAPQGPVASVPAPREAEPTAPAAPEAESAPDVVQRAEDLETRAADQEESMAPVEEAQQSTGPAAPAYDDVEREAVLKVMRERRDIRNGFRSDPIPHEVLLRVLEAAHTAPSVGHSQPWDFVVIRSTDTRRAMHELAMRQRDAYAKSLPKGRAKQFKELKIEAILDTPVNIVVTADPTRGGRHTLGRHTQPQMAPYSAALAVENLWLAARAEGLGVGWVSFFDEREMVRALGLPEHLEVIAYLCVGYVDEFPDEPELMQAGWSKRRPLSWVVHEETYGRRALPGEEPHDLLAETVAQIRPLDAKALGEAWERQKRMTKPAGALGMLEIISAQLSGLSRQCPPPIPEPAAVAIFAGDHGVHAQGVTPWPQEVTAQMVANFLGGGAVCNAFANQVGAEVCVVDVGVAADLPATPGLLPRKIRGGTSDMTTGPAMTREEAKAAIEVGIETARDLVAAGNKALLTGEMGIANTTASAALISVFTGADPAEVTGRGTGINDETLARKTEVVRRALEFHQPDPADPIGVLAAIGGFEHAAIVGLLLGGASLRTPVILDGVSAGAAALVARAIAPEVLAACIAGHRSAEPGHVAALNKLGLRPLVDLDLRLGEGTGALLALPLVQSTARAMHEVATFDSAGVTEK